MAATPSALQVEIAGAVAHVRFDRPAVRNAFDDHVAAELARTFQDLGARDDLRVIVLGGAGDVFCAGGDLNWMRRVADYTRSENLVDAEAFQEAFEAVDRCPLPVVGRIHGAALGGGAGLIACCDIAVAAEDTVIGFPEVRLGLVPGVISPYVLRKIGLSHTRHLFLTGQRISAEEAHRIGRVHFVAPEDDIDEVVEDVVAQLLRCAPEALAGAKVLLRNLVDSDHAGAARIALDAITDARASDDGRECLTAFLEKRMARWLT
mgnify:CR=1 FL=1